MNDTSTATPVRGLSYVACLTLVAILGGVLAGCSALSLGHFFTYPPDVAASLSNVNANVDFDLVTKLDRQLLIKNTTLSATVAGALVVCLVSVLASTGAGLPQRLGLGLLVGVISGALGGLLAALTWQILRDNDVLVAAGNDTSTLAAVGNSVLWACIGAGAGIAAVHRGGRVTAAVAGLFGGIVGVWAFVMVAGLALAAVKTELPLPSNVPDTPWPTARILWGLIPAAFIGLFVARTNIGHRPEGTQDSPPDAAPAVDEVDSE